MRFSLVVVVLIFFSFKINSQTPAVIKITDLEKRIKNNSDTTYIVNFWATWCVPCVKELPSFDSVNTEFNKSRVKVLLISLDFSEDLTTKLIPFINRKKINSEVMLLDEVNGNYFIPKISENWTGSIPATLIINNKKNINHFFEQSINYKLLVSEIDSTK